MVLFPIALIWVAAVLFFIIRRSTNAEPTDEHGTEPRWFRRPGGPRDPRRPDATARSGARRSQAERTRR